MKKKKKCDLKITNYIFRKVASTMAAFFLVCCKDPVVAQLKCMETIRFRGGTVAHHQPPVIIMTRRFKSLWRNLMLSAIEIERSAIAQDNIMKGLIGSLIIVLLLSLVGCSQDNEDNAGTDGTTVIEAPTATDEVQVAEVVEEPTEVDEPPTLSPPIVAVHTNTPVPATDTPAPTDTPVPTAVPPTNTPVPIPPTSPPPPPPTAVPAPPTEPPPPPPPPIGANGLVASSFVVENPSAGTNESVWFEFTLDNQTGSEVSYNLLGVMPRKDGVDRPEWYQQSYGGRNSTIDAGGFTWKDNIKLPETGDYGLRLVMCFDGFETCSQGTGTWHSMSGEVPVSIK